MRDSVATEPRKLAAVECRISLSDPWSHRLMMALLQRYGIKAYRYNKQRRSTIMVKASRRFIDETLMPEYKQLHDTMVEYFEEVAQRVISKALGDDTSDTEMR